MLFYTNGEQLWDRNHALMPNGSGLRSHVSASQGTLVLRDLSGAKKYYLFTVDACENLLVAGLRYSVVDMMLRGGLGDIGLRKNVLVPSPSGPLTEKLTAVHHANGRDYWIVVHGWRTNEFYSYLFTAAGIAATPRVSAVGSVHQGGQGSRGNENAVGHLKASPDGHLLACAIRDQEFQLFNFDPATGAVSNARTLGFSAPYYYGAEFSPDGSKLYTTDLPGSTLYQIDIANNLSVTQIARTSAATGAVQRGPDGQLYVAMDQAPYLGVITKPNNAGSACGFIERGVSLGSGRSRIGLPNAAEVRNQFSAAITGDLAVCAGTILSLSGTSTLSAGAVQLAWDFGDPASGVANVATGPAVTHYYATAGKYVVTLTATTQNEQFTTMQTVVVSPLPTLSLGPRPLQLCSGASLTLTASAQPTGSTYRWQDGSTGTSYQVQAPGRYRLRVTSPQGCVVKDSVDVFVGPQPLVQLRPDTILCENSVLVLRVGPQPAGSTYRWQDGSTEASLVVRKPGTYSLEVRNTAGCVAQEAFVALAEPCPFTIPNIITPNGDRNNEYFVLEGLNAAAWNLTMFDRWGREIYRRTAYDNRWNAAGQPTGIYFYLLENPTTNQHFKGWVEVAR